jgi:hypothetical protein
MKEETHLEAMLKNHRRKTLRERYLDAKVVFLTEKLSRIQEEIDKRKINQDIGFLAMMLYVQEFIAKEAGKGYARDIYERLAFTKWPFSAYEPLLRAGDLKEKAGLAARVFVELEEERIRREAEGYIKEQVLRVWRELGLSPSLDRAGLVKKLVEEKRRLYSRIGSRADRERRRLVKELAEKGARKTELKLLNVGIIPTELCPTECRFCLAPWKSSVKERLGRALREEEFREIAREAVGFANKHGLIVTITGGEPLLEMERVLYVIGIANTRVELTTSGYWARSMEATRRILGRLERAVRSNNSPSFSFSLQLSVDFFHQEVRRGKNGELKETVPVEYLANVVEAVLREHDLDLCLLPKYTRYEDPLVLLLEELAGRGLKARIARKFYDPRLRVSIPGEDGRLVEKPALLKAYLSFGSARKQVFLLYTAVEGIGGASVLEPFEYPAFKQRTAEFLEQEESTERFPVLGLEVSDDGNVYPGAHALYSWCLGNLLETSMEEIARNLEYDPLVIALAENPARIKNIALKARPELRGELEKASSPLVALYKILEDDTLRLHITKKLVEEYAEGIPRRG